ncbi:MAG: hypothetical protein QXG00_08585, partial [Candidatus Woesearchaeota archaeon]
DIVTKIRRDYLYYKSIGYSRVFSFILATRRDAYGKYKVGDLDRMYGTYAPDFVKSTVLFGNYKEILGMSTDDDIPSGESKDDYVLVIPINDLMYKNILNTKYYIDRFFPNRNSGQVEGEKYQTMRIRNGWIEVRSLGGAKGFEQLQTKKGVKGILTMGISQIFRKPREVTVKEAYRILYPYISNLNVGVDVEIGTKSKTHPTAYFQKKDEFYKERGMKSILVSSKRLKNFDTTDLKKLQQLLDSITDENQRRFVFRNLPQITDIKILRFLFEKYGYYMISEYSNKFSDFMDGSYVTLINFYFDKYLTDYLEKANNNETDISSLIRILDKLNSTENEFHYFDQVFEFLCLKNTSFLPRYFVSEKEFSSDERFYSYLRRKLFNGKEISFAADILFENKTALVLYMLNEGVPNGFLTRYLEEFFGDDPDNIVYNLIKMADKFSTDNVIQIIRLYPKFNEKLDASAFATLLSQPYYIINFLFTDFDRNSFLDYYNSKYKNQIIKGLKDVSSPFLRLSSPDRQFVAETIFKDKTKYRVTLTRPLLYLFRSLPRNFFDTSPEIMDFIKKYKKTEFIKYLPEDIKVSEAMMDVFINNNREDQFVRYYCNSNIPVDYWIRHLEILNNGAYWIGLNANRFVHIQKVIERFLLDKNTLFFAVKYIIKYRQKTIFKNNIRTIFSNQDNLNAYLAQVESEINEQKNYSDNDRLVRDIIYSYTYLIFKNIFPDKYILSIYNTYMKKFFPEDYTDKDDFVQEEYWGQVKPKWAIQGTTVYENPSPSDLAKIKKEVVNLDGFRFIIDYEKGRTFLWDSNGALHSNVLDSIHDIENCITGEYNFHTQDIFLSEYYSKNFHTMKFLLTMFKNSKFPRLFNLRKIRVKLSDSGIGIYLIPVK